MKFKVNDVGLFKALFKGITRFTDTAHFDVKKKGVQIRSVDPYDFCYVDINLPPSLFDGYKINSKTFSFGVDLSKIGPIVRNIGSKELFLEIADNSLQIKLVNGWTTNYKLNWMEEDSDLPDPLKQNYTAKVTIPSTDFLNIIKDASTVSREIEFEVDKKELRVSATKQGFTYSTKLEFKKRLQTKIELNGNSAKSSAILDYLRTLSEIIIKCKEVELNLGDNLPLRLDLKYRGGGTFTFIISNKQITTSRTAGEVRKDRIESSPKVSTSSMPQITVTKFPDFIKSLNVEDGVDEHDALHSIYETDDGDFTRIAKLLGLVKRRKGRLYLSEDGLRFAKSLRSDSRPGKRRLHKIIQEKVPEYNKLLNFLSSKPSDVAAITDHFKFSKKKGAIITKKDDIILLLGLATYCNMIDRKLGLYYFEK